MRTWFLLCLLAAGTLAGCASDDGEVAIIAFKATYAGSDGGNFTVQLDGPRQFLDRDGQVRAAYALQTGEENGFFGRQTQALDSAMQVWRKSGCWAFGEGDEVCGHLQARWVNGTEPAYGVGGLLRGETLGAKDGRLRVLADGEPGDTELYFYEYKPGNLWPERYLRSVSLFDHEETIWSLVNVTVGGRLSGAAPRPVAPTAASPAENLFPAADQMFLPFPFTIADGLEGLKGASAEANEILAAGCVITVQHRGPWPRFNGPLPVNPVPALLGNEVVGSMTYGLMDADGDATSWQVDLRRDILGQGTFTATKQEYGPMAPVLLCDDRIGGLVGPDDVLANLPRDLVQGNYSSFTATWDHCCYGQYGTHLGYAIAWQEDGEPHWRSAEVNASTGLYTRFTYKPGDQIDPA